MAVISIGADDKGKKVLEKAGINIGKELKNSSVAWLEMLNSQRG